MYIAKLHICLKPTSDCIKYHNLLCEENSFQIPQAISDFLKTQTLALTLSKFEMISQRSWSSFVEQSMSHHYYMQAAKPKSGK